MKVALLERTGHIELRESGKPIHTGPDDVLIQVKAVGICGSEIHAFEGTHPFRSAPVVMGHEMAGVVAATGDQVQGLIKGDRVIVDPQKSCGHCNACLTGNPNICLEHEVLGTAKWPGGFGEYVVVPQDVVIHLPDQLSFVQGAAIEPLSVAVHIAHRAKLKAGNSIAILGAGSIGGLTCAVSRAMGANPVIAVDIHQHCLDAARDCLGATHGFLVPDHDLPNRIKEITRDEGVDIVVLCADDVTLLNLGMEILKPQGTIVLVALMTEALLRFAAYDAIRKEAQIIGSFMGNIEDVQESLNLVVAGKVDLMGIITHVLPIEQAQYGMQLACTKDEGAIKVILTHS